MIKKLNIKNFKSIKDLEFTCSRVNIFIGEPNTGKSNILESIGMSSMIHNQKTGINAINSLYDYVRAEETKNLFYNNIIDEPIIIYISSSIGNDIFSIIYNNGEFLIECSDLANQKVWIEAHIDKYFRNNQYPKYAYSQVLPIRFYKYKKFTEFDEKDLDFLTPPYGNNLLTLINSRKDLKEFVKEVFKKYDYKIQTIEDLGKIYFVKDFDGELITLPYKSLSDSISRMIFYYAAIQLSNEAIIILEEPEVHVFSLYNEDLALRVAYSNNQFFIATHNPYFLNMLINKTKSEDLNVLKVIYQNNQTKVRPISKNKLQNFIINDNDILLHLDRLDEV